MEKDYARSTENKFICVAQKKLRVAEKTIMYHKAK